MNFPKIIINENIGAVRARKGTYFTEKIRGELSEFPPIFFLTTVVSADVRGCLP